MISSRSSETRVHSIRLIPVGVAFSLFSMGFGLQSVEILFLRREGNQVSQAAVSYQAEEGRDEISTQFTDKLIPILHQCTSL